MHIYRYKYTYVCYKNYWNKKAMNSQKSKEKYVEWFALRKVTDKKDVNILWSKQNKRFYIYICEFYTLVLYWLIMMFVLCEAL